MKECALASLGLVHMFASEGRILRVCGEKVTVISEKAMKTDASDQRRMTEAFFGLAPAAAAASGRSNGGRYTVSQTMEINKANMNSQS